MAELPPGGEPNSEPLKYQTWVLKVSIHCEGCKKKVKKILNSVYGVYTIDVDTKQQKVTVTGNVDSNTLIRKLEKSGKHAELLLPAPPKNPNKKKDRSFQHHQKQQSHEGQANQNNPTVNTEQPQKNGDTSNGAVENSNPAKGNDGNQNPISGNHQQKQQQGKGVKFEGSTPSAGEDKKPPENAADEVGKSAGGGGASGASGGKKKKKKKENNGGDTNNGNNCNVEVSGQPPAAATNGGPASTESPPPQQGPNPGPYPNPNPVNMSPPRHPNHYRVSEYPPAYFVPPPVYAVSYNTAHPSSSYTTSYYYPAPPPYSSAYVSRAADVAQPPPLDWNSHSSQPSDSFEMFSDENPNACSVM